MTDDGMGRFFGEGNTTIYKVVVEGHIFTHAQVVKPVLRLMLKEWTDWDMAAYFLGVSLGIWKGDSVEWYERAKGGIWSTNMTSELLNGMMMDMVRLEQVEYREETEDQFRWKDDGKDKE